MAPDGVWKEPEAQASGACVAVREEDGGGTYLPPAAPVRFPGFDDTPKSASPMLGQHTIGTLKASGFSDAEIDGLRSAGAIA